MQVFATSLNFVSDSRSKLCDKLYYYAALESGLDYKDNPNEQGILPKVAPKVGKPLNQTVIDRALTFIMLKNILSDVGKRGLYIIISV